jgi:hypothetical protein
MFLRWLEICTPRLRGDLLLPSPNMRTTCGESSMPGIHTNQRTWSLSAVGTLFCGDAEAAAGGWLSGQIIMRPRMTLCKVSELKPLSLVSFRKGHARPREGITLNHPCRKPEIAHQGNSQPRANFHPLDKVFLLFDSSHTISGQG